MRPQLRSIPLCFSKITDNEKVIKFIAGFIRPSNTGKIISKNDIFLFHFMRQHDDII